MFDSLALAQDDTLMERKATILNRTLHKQLHTLFPNKKKPDRLAQPIFDGLVQCPTGFSLKKSVAVLRFKGLEAKIFFVQFFGELEGLFFQEKPLKKTSDFCDTKRRAQFLFV